MIFFPLFCVITVVETFCTTYTRTGYSCVDSSQISLTSFKGDSASVPISELGGMIGRKLAHCFNSSISLKSAESLLHSSFEIGSVFLFSHPGSFSIGLEFSMVGDILASFSVDALGWNDSKILSEDSICSINSSKSVDMILKYNLKS